jgi:hypothetical protein
MNLPVESRFSSRAPAYLLVVFLPGSARGRTRYSPQHQMNACQNAIAAAFEGHAEALFWSSIIHRKGTFEQ